MTNNKPTLQLNRLSAVAQIAVQRPTIAADSEIPLDKIEVRDQVRRTFRDLDSLAASIQESGVIQPIIVLAGEGERYRLIAGERRVRAARIAGLAKIPAVIKRNLTDLEVRALQVAENNDRDALTAYDQAMGVIEDVERFGTEVAARIWNRSKGWVSKRVATGRYDACLLSLLREGHCEDLETLHCLHEIHQLSEAQASRLIAALQTGVPLSRSAAREQLATLRAWQAERQPAAMAPATAATTVTESTERQGDVPGTSGARAQANEGEPKRHSAPRQSSVEVAPVVAPKPDAAEATSAEDRQEVIWMQFLREIAPALRAVPEALVPELTTRLATLVQNVPLSLALRFDNDSEI
ncbi:MAG: ParB/RepB/Spo0J family partition protein [Pigmentiphaga sp.]|nr:ParB/RepB/Spo0J family partition protein [Pigmentiphaga sp.]